jgi:hypothetical protein
MESNPGFRTHPRAFVRLVMFRLPRMLPVYFFTARRYDPMISSLGKDTLAGHRLMNILED